MSEAMDRLMGLHAGTTEGEWVAETHADIPEVACVDEIPICAWLGFDDSFRPLAEHAANVAFIAAAHNTLPKIAAEHRAMDNALEQMTIQAEQYIEQRNALLRRCEAAEARAEAWEHLAVFRDSRPRLDYDWNRDRELEAAAISAAERKT